MVWLFYKAVTANPLLDESEVNQLLSAAPARETNQRTPRSNQGRSGSLLTPSKGAGTDFAELRAYHTGDDPRRIDWRSTARSQTPLVRTFHKELSQPFCIVIDRTASMRFGTQTRLKVTQAARIALWLAGREIRAGREICALILDTPQQWITPQMGITAVKRWTDTAIAPCPPIESNTENQDWAHIAAVLRQRLTQGSELILISDFIGLKPSDTPMLQALGQYYSTTAIRIIDDSEVKLPQTQNLQLNWGSISRRVPTQQSPQARYIEEQIQAWHEFVSTQLEKSTISVYELNTNRNELEEFGRKIL